MATKSKYILILPAIFSVAMGFIESAVVVYLREIYYPEGFEFPLQPIDKAIAVTEILREAATIIMLVMVGLIAGRTGTEKFGIFIFCFAIWDICYYLFLYLLLGWPESLLTWDILFLIPVTWVGPVIGPLINSLTMLAFAILIWWFTNLNIKTMISRTEWILLIAGSIIIILSYTIDYTQYILSRVSFAELIKGLSNEELIEHLSAYIPQKFYWWIYITGQAILISTLVLFFFRNKNILTQINQ